MTTATFTFTSAKAKIAGASAALLDEFGAERLEETAFPVYMNSFAPARYLGWSRVQMALRLLGKSRGRTALDFGCGLGVMLPFLHDRYEHVVACDTDPSIPEFMIRQLGLSGIEVSTSPHVNEGEIAYDVVVALDVLEHVDNLAEVYKNLYELSAPGAVWIISGPTENLLYKTMRKIARTSGEGHVRTIYDVFQAVPNGMRRESAKRLPFGLPLFLVGKFVKE